MTLASQLGGPGGDLLGIHQLIGGGAAAPFRQEPLRRLQARVQASGVLRETLERRRAEGWKAMVVMGDQRLFELLGKRAGDNLPLPIPLVPNLRGFMREAVEHGMMGAGMRRVMQVDMVSLLGFALPMFGRLGQLKRRDFTTFVRSFIELELGAFSRYKPPLVFLQPQMTDMAVAFNNPRIIEAFNEAVRRRLGALPGLATENFGTVTSALKRWGLETHAMIAPWQADGAHMRPDQESCVRAARACEFPIWADRLGHPDPPDPADRDLMKVSGLIGAVRDDFSLWTDL